MEGRGRSALRLPIRRCNAAVDGAVDQGDENIERACGEVLCKLFAKGLFLFFSERKQKYFVSYRLIN